MSVALSLSPQSFQEALAFAERLAATSMVPEADQGNPGNILAKIQFGHEIGLPPMQSVQKLFVNKGRVGMEVSAMQALVEASGLCEDLESSWDPEKKEARATTKKKGRKPVTMAFSWADAVTAGLADKSTYKSYPQRLCRHRAMGFLLQDVYPEVLRGVVHLEQFHEIVEMESQRDRGLERPALPPAQVEALSPELQAKLTEAFDLCALLPAQRTVKLAEFRGREDELLDWCRGEYAARHAKRTTTAVVERASRRRAPAAPAAPAAGDPPIVVQPVVEPDPVVKVQEPPAPSAGTSLVEALDAQADAMDQAAASAEDVILGAAPSPDEVFV